MAESVRKIASFHAQPVSTPLVKYPAQSYQSVTKTRYRLFRLCGFGRLASILSIVWRAR